MGSPTVPSVAAIQAAIAANEVPSDLTGLLQWILVLTSGSGGGGPTGPAGGDLSGTYPNPGVAKIKGNTVPVNAVGQLTNNGAGALSWVPTLPLAGGTLTGELIIHQSNNTVALQLTGSSLTGANAQTLLDLVQTWNTSGAPTAIRLRITKTAADNAALLIDLGTVALGSLFKVDAFGGMTVGGATNGGNQLTLVGPFGSIPVRAGGDNDFGIKGLLSCLNGMAIFDGSNANPVYLSRVAAGVFGIGSSNYGTSNGAIRLNVVTTATDYPILLSDSTVFVDSTAAARAPVLPDATLCPGQAFTVKDWKGQSAANNITTGTTGGQTIDGSATKVLSTNYASFTFVSDGANWGVI